MSADKPRAPRAFKLDSLSDNDKPAVNTKAMQKVAAKVATGKNPTIKARKPRAISSEAVLKAVPDDAAQRVPMAVMRDADVADALTPPPPISTKSRFKWGRIFWLALGGLVSLAMGLWLDSLIRDLFARQDWLGWLAVGFSVLLALAALAILVRELWGLSRMRRIDKLHSRAVDVLANDDMKSAKAVALDLIELYDSRTDTARGRALLTEHCEQIIDGRDLLALAERDLMTSLDEKARALVMGSAKRVSVVTAVSPRALIDVGFVLVENMRLMRRVSELYGGRPGTLGFFRLARTTIGHLAVTGSIAVGDGIVQQLVGHGVAAKISTRLGEGVINGLLTARIGIAAIDVCRPLPFSDLTRPSVRDFMGELTRFSTKDSGEKQAT